MSVSLDLIFYIVALVFFALAFFGVAVSRFNLVAGGLFFWLLAAAF